MGHCKVFPRGILPRVVMDKTATNANRRQRPASERPEPSDWAGGAHYSLFAGPLQHLFGYHHHLSREVAALLAAFIFREVSQSVEAVGLGTDMILLAAKDQRIYSLPHPKVKELEGIAPDLRDVIADAWNKGVTIPGWLTDFLT